MLYRTRYKRRQRVDLRGKPLDCAMGYTHSFISRKIIKKRKTFLWINDYGIGTNSIFSIYDGFMIPHFTPLRKCCCSGLWVERKYEQEKKGTVLWFNSTYRVIQMRSMLHIMRGFIHRLRSSKWDLIDDHDSVSQWSIQVLGVDICFGGY